MDPAPNEPKKAKPYNNYLKYSSLTFQLAGGIALSAWGGHKLDQYFGLTFPVFLLSLVILVFTGTMIMVYRSLNKE